MCTFSSLESLVMVRIPPILYLMSGVVVIVWKKTSKSNKTRIFAQIRQGIWILVFDLDWWNVKIKLYYSIFQKKITEKKLLFNDQNGLKLLLSILKAVTILGKKLKIFIIIFFNFSFSFFLRYFPHIAPGRGFRTIPNFFEYSKSYSDSKN